MKQVVIIRDGFRMPFNESLIAEAVARAAEAIGAKKPNVAFPVPSFVTLCPFGTIEDLEPVPCMKGHPPYLFSLAKLLKVSCRRVRPP